MLVIYCAELQNINNKRTEALTQTDIQKRIHLTQDQLEQFKKLRHAAYLLKFDYATFYKDELKNILNKVAIKDEHVDWKEVAGGFREIVLETEKLGTTPLAIKHLEMLMKTIMIAPQESIEGSELRTIGRTGSYIGNLAKTTLGVITLQSSTKDLWQHYNQNLLTISRLSDDDYQQESIEPTVLAFFRKLFTKNKNNRYDNAYINFLQSIENAQERLLYYNVKKASIRLK